MTTSSTSLDGSSYAFAIVVSRFNPAITEKLLSGAQEALQGHGVLNHNIDVLRVPGAFEIPVVAKQLAQTGRYQAIICLGAVIRGETDHYEYVAGEAARGIAQVGLDTGVPAIFGVLAAETEAHVQERAGGKMGNKGWQAALAAIEMARVMESSK